MKKKKKFYTVRQGKKTGVFDTWEKCQKCVTGFPSAQYKSFPTLKTAEQALKIGYKHYVEHKTKLDIFAKDIPFVRNSIAVDAACSWNPGVMEYRGVDLQNGKEIFHKKFELGTNNIWEFLAIVHGLWYLQKNKLDQTAIYTDSRTAMSRISKKKCKTLLKKSDQTQKLFEVIKRAEKWLKKNTFANKIIKRDTKTRWEIPADFGRK